jgi:uncharacterized membrane protein YhaH (DUF805 family)
MHWFIEPITNQYADFKGRTGREAYWMFVLISLALQIAISIVEVVVGTTFLGILFLILILIPSIAIAARRLHDINKSGWWQLIGLIPLVGIIILIVWLATKGNKHGEGTMISDTFSEEEVPVAETVAMPTAVSEPTSESTPEPEHENMQQGYENKER